MTPDPGRAPTRPVLTPEQVRWVTQLLAEFRAQVNARAEADMLAGNPVTGAHHRALDAFDIPTFVHRAALSPPAPPLNIVGESVRPDDSDPRGGEVSTDD